jgi:hypothetical protein
MTTAAQAFEIAARKHKQATERILKMIESAAEQGQFCLIIDTSTMAVSDDVQSVLSGYGYHIYNQDNLLKIWWG